MALKILENFKISLNMINFIASSIKYFEMKKLLLLTAFSPLMSFAQMTEANEPDVPSTSTLYLCDSNAVRYENITGTGVTWDYRNLLGVDTDDNGMAESKVLTVAATDMNSLDSLFGGASTKYSIGNLLTTYYSVGQGTKVSTGNIFSEPSLGSVYVRWNENPQSLKEYPFDLNSSVVDSFEGNMSVDNALIPIDTTATGSGITKIDGFGTLRLQQNDYTDVTRYVIQDTLNATIFNALIGEQPIQLIRSWYEYYQLGTGKLPIMVVISISLNSALLNNTSTLVLTKDLPEGNLGLDKNEIAFQAYPNPTNEFINLKIEGDFTAKLSDISGKVMLSNITSTQINVSEIPAGMYFLTVSNDKGASTQRIIKR
jgi:hypothetical protein